MKNNGRLNRSLRLVSFVTGLAILIISIYWSQDGFNFGAAGDSGYTNAALIIGYTLAISVTVIEFVFSTNFRELNGTLILLGFASYGYSIWTNKEGIVHFQGMSVNEIAAWFLGFCMDVAPEPLIGWALGESRSGDFVGNISKSVGKMFSNAVNSIMDGGNSTPSKQEQRPEPFRQENRGQGKSRRELLESQYHGKERRKDEDTKPNKFAGFGE